MPRHAVALVALLSLGLASPCRGAVSAVTAWPVDALVKVFPSDPPPGAPAALPEIPAACGQHVALQVALRAPARLDGVTAECRPLEGPGGVFAADVRVHAVGLVVVGSHTDDVPAEERVGEAPGLFPDPLVDLPLVLEKDRTRSVWATIRVPREAAPGTYRSALVVRAGKEEVARVPLRLRVAAAVVPAERTLRVANWFRVDDRHTRQFWDAPQFSEAWWATVANLARVMAEYRQNVILTPTLDLVERLPGEPVRFSFERFDRWVETFRRAGALDRIEGGHLLDRAGGYDEPLRVPVLGADGKKADLALDDPEAFRFLEAFLPALGRHLDEKGWRAIHLQHVLDEPHGDEPAAYARVAALVRKHLPGVPTIDAIDAKDVPEALREASDVWVINLNQTLLPSGDAFIVYPDKARRSVFSSIRLEAMRAGIEDYEMLQALARRDRAAADAIAGEAVRSFTDYVRDPAAFRRIEARLIEALSAAE